MSKLFVHQTLILSAILLTGVTGCSSVQKFQASKLPANLLAESLSNAQKVSLASFSNSAPETDQIGPGDVLEVSIAAGLSREDTFTYPVRVKDSGLASFPNLNDIQLAGYELDEAEAIIHNALVEAGQFRNPHVSLFMKKPKTHRVMVVGAVEKPGVYYLRSSSSNLVSALTSAGGLAKDAGTKVDIKNPGRPNNYSSQPKIAGQPNNPIHVAGHSVPVHTSGARSIQIDLASSSDIAKSNFQITDGGVVTVEKRVAKPVHVMGLVRRPGRHEFPVSEDLLLLDAISLAEGIANPVADKIYIIRNKPGQKKPALIQASIAKAKTNPKENLRLSPGDIVSVEKTPATIFIETIRTIGFTIGGSVF